LQQNMSLIEDGFFYGGDGYYNHTIKMFTAVMNPKYSIKNSGFSLDTFINSIYEAQTFDVPMQWTITIVSCNFSFLI